MTLYNNREDSRDGLPLSLQEDVMTLSARSQPVRRKAVWGPKRLLTAAVLVAFGLSANGIAKALSQSETAALNSAIAAKDLAAFEKLASEQNLRMEKAWATEIQRTLKQTNDAQVASLLDQLRLEREYATAAAFASTDGSAPPPVASRAESRARTSTPASGRQVLTTHTNTGMPVAKAWPGRPNFAAKPHKLDIETERRKGDLRGSSSVIVQL